MAEIKVTITDTELKGLESVALDPEEWINNLIKNRARKSVTSICAILLQHCNENDIAMAVGQDAQVTQAYDLKLAKKAENKDFKPD
tara:strand:- start:467 stop:724 length:258 start_codon:yes stop_codon:yes gene_type:complete